MNNFKGWKTVFDFTFKRSISKGYKIVTGLIALLIIGALILVNILVAKPEAEEKASNIRIVYVVDESGLNPTDYRAYLQQLEPVKYKETNFTYLEGKTQEEANVIADQGSAQSVVVLITKNEDGFQLAGTRPSKSIITEGEISSLLDSMKECFEYNKLSQVGLSKAQLDTIRATIQSTYQSVGEDTSIAAMIIKMLVPMVFGLVMYLLLLIHGQTVSKSVSTEKTSKLMETLLTSIHPYALITGKILAISAMAIMQFLIWVISAVIGLYGGNWIAHSMYPEYENAVVQIISFLRDNIGESALTMGSVILAIAIFCIGFLFYCVLAGLAGCMVSKPEDVASTQGIFVFPILVSWLVVYLGAAAENVTLLSVARFIPFTIPFGVPVDLLTGAISLTQGVISLVILLAFSVLVIMISARLYKGLVLYHGQKLSWKKIGQVIRAKS